MISYKNLEIWFVTGSQHLYGDDVLKKVKEHSILITRHLNKNSKIPIKIKFKNVTTSPEEILSTCKAVNATKNCIGLITWMHTFSPGKMWIAGLKVLQKPLLHLHTQFNDEIPWGKINMDFMNLNQSAHGGREFGFISTRVVANRKVVAGHWTDPQVIQDIAFWTRAAAGWHDSQSIKVARFGDNMRDVAVTEGNQVSAQIKFGYSVNGYGLETLTDQIKSIQKNQINELIEEYIHQYEIAKSLLPKGKKHKALIEAARIESGFKKFLEAGKFKAFTDTFENLSNLIQLPGIAVQRLMALGYGFGAEGDWKTAALVRTMKVMAHGLEGGNSFMEDYTYHFGNNNHAVLGAHMLEICPSITSHQPKCEIHPLGIGGKSDPVRLVFEADQGPGLNVSIIDLGNRFRMIVNTLDIIKPIKELPNLPVARALWKPHPDLKNAATCWILAGGAHHTCFSQNIHPDILENFAEIAGIECVIIDEKTEIRNFKQTLRNNEVYYN